MTVNFRKFWGFVAICFSMKFGMLSVGGTSEKSMKVFSTFSTNSRKFSTIWYSQWGIFGSFVSYLSLNSSPPLLPSSSPLHLPSFQLFFLLFSTLSPHPPLFVIFPLLSPFSQHWTWGYTAYILISICSEIQLYSQSVLVCCHHLARLILKYWCQTCRGSWWRDTAER